MTPTNLDAQALRTKLQDLSAKLDDLSAQCELLATEIYAIADDLDQTTNTPITIQCQVFPDGRVQGARLPEKALEKA